MRGVRQLNSSVPNCTSITFYPNSTVRYLFIYLTWHQKRPGFWPLSSGRFISKLHVLSCEKSLWATSMWFRSVERDQSPGLGRMPIRWSPSKNSEHRSWSDHPDWKYSEETARPRCWELTCPDPHRRGLRKQQNWFPQALPHVLPSFGWFWFCVWATPGSAQVAICGTRDQIRLSRVQSKCPSHRMMLQLSRQILICFLSL